MTLIRAALKDLDISQIIVHETIVDDMLAYFHRQNDHAHIRRGIKDRFGMGIKRVDDPHNKNASIETYVRSGFDIQVDSGGVEVLSMGFATRVVAALATLFTEPGQRFTLLGEGEKDLSEADELLREHRASGGFSAAMSLVDWRSVQVGSAAVFVTYSGGGLTYQVLSPSDVRAYFGDTIVDEGVVRATDKTDVEDASIVVIRLSRVNTVAWRYLAIFGRSDVYPQGRYVTFEASNNSLTIPKVGDGDAIDYMIGGSVANPLSIVANQYPDQLIPEYPIAIIKGGVAESGDLMPVSSSLYEDSVSFDVSGSHLLETSGDAARGTTVVECDEQATGKPLPRTLRGQIALVAGQKVDHIAHGAAESVAALDVHTKLETEVAAGYSVPDFMVSSKDHAIEASSGIALEVKSRPLKKQRRYRVELNTPAVRKIFAVERSLLGLFAANETGVALLLTCTQVWDAGELRLPENRKEMVERISTLLDKGIFDMISAIREWYQLSTDAEAIKIYEKMKDRKTEFPSLTEEPKKTLGLMGR